MSHHEDDGTRSLGDEPAAPDEIAHLLEAYMAAVERGESPDREALLAAHPMLAGALAECLDAVDFIHSASARASGADPARAGSRLGDFRIVREIGSGGMGVVFEAEQISLGRRVALKVLRFGSSIDSDGMQRFRREAETVAALHHTNIVPVHAVGEESGVHYYAMQLIEGESVADVTARARESGEPLDALEVARWGLQAAEALAHAHARAVIHRDVKPSNLILDRDGRIWLTDFGLARRLDDATLSLSGALLGTPRYMSPEQASTVRRPIDHRTDVYSLGATLYETLTLRPAFDADSALGVISQILEREPSPPRRWRRDVPRDLETIVVKCLAKAPAQRYGTAGLLASDLRAFLDDRPIAARRPGLVERSVKVARKHRRSVAVAAATAVVSMLAVLVAIAGWRKHEADRLGRLLLNSGDESLRVEVLDADGSDVVPPYRTPTEAPVEIPEGSQRVRLTSSTLPSQTWQLEVERGKTLSVEIDTDKARLFEPLEWRRGGRPSIDTLALDGRTDLIVLGSSDGEDGRTRRALARLNGRDSSVVWQIDFSRGQVSEDAAALGWSRGAIAAASPRSPAGVHIDVDGDGTPDVIRGSNRLVAISGEDGRLVWMSAAIEGKRRLLAVLAHDVDRDGAIDVVAASGGEGVPLALTAVSGPTGSTLWTWRGAANLAPDDLDVWSFSRVPHGGSTVIVAASGSSVAALDVSSGSEAWRTLDLGTRPAVAPRAADLDGDGFVEVVTVEQLEQAEDGWGLRLRVISPRSGSDLWHRELAARAPTGHRPSWPLLADLDGDRRIEIAVPTRHRDARSAGYALEVLDGASGERRWTRWWFDDAARAERRADSPSETLRTELDAAAAKDPGGMVFSLLLPSRSAERTQLDRFVAGPDIDADGFRDYFTASFDDRPHGLFVTALSGRDGQTLWWTREPLQNASIGPLRWWRPLGDDQPLLLLPYDNERRRHNHRVIDGVEIPSEPSGTRIYDSSSGENAGTIPGHLDLGTADLDGDGVLDVFGLRRVDDDDVSWRLDAFRGRAPEAWRRLGAFRPTSDLDGDGLGDLVGEGLSISGRDGRVIWRGDAAEGRALSEEDFADIDRDGIPDLFSFAKPQEIAAYSGRTGVRLWSTEIHEESTEAMWLHGVGSGSSDPDPLLVDLDGDGQGEIVRFYQRIFGLKSEGEKEFALGRIAVVSAIDGRLRWQQSFAEAEESWRKFEPVVADLDGDGVRDVVGMAIDSENRTLLRAISGSNGKPLWSHTLSKRVDTRHTPLVSPLALDLDADGAAEIISIDRVHELDAEAARSDTESDKIALRGALFRVEALRGTTGEPLWTWEGIERGPHLIWSQQSVWGARGSAARLADHGPCVCLALYANGVERTSGRARWPERFSTVILDARGELIHFAQETLRGGMSSLRSVESTEVHASDLDGDGADEVLWLNDDRLIASRAAPDEPLWTTEFSRGFRPWRSDWGLPSPLIAVSPRTPTRPAIIRVRTGRGYRALDARNGAELWTTRGSELLTTDAPERAPRLVDHVDGGTICFTSASERAQVDAGPPLDPRYARPLPWHNPGRDAFFAAAAIDSLVFIAAPLLLLLWAIRWRSRRLGVLLLAYTTVVAAAYLVELLPRTRHLESPATLLAAIDVFGTLPALPLSNYAIGLPLVAAAGVAVVLAAQRRWRSETLLLASSVLLAALLASWQLFRDGVEKDTLEFWDTRGWLGIWFHALYWIGAGALLAIVCRWTIRQGRRAWRIARRQR